MFYNLKIRLQFKLLVLLVTSFADLSQCSEEDFITVDHCDDLTTGSQWEFPKGWVMHCFENIDLLKGNATVDKYNTMIPKDFNWSAFEDATGIWGFFYQDPAPAFDLPPPVITYKSLTTSLSSFQLKYYMYGNETDHLRIFTESMEEDVNPDCGFYCVLEFVETDRIFLDKDCKEGSTLCGVHSFTIALEMTPGQSFLFIDKIVAHKPTLPDPSTSTATLTDTTPYEELTTKELATIFPTTETNTVAPTSGSTSALISTETQPSTTQTATPTDTTPYKELTTSELTTIFPSTEATTVAPTSGLTSASTSTEAQPSTTQTVEITTVTSTTEWSTTLEQGFESITVDSCKDANGQNWEFPTDWLMFCYNDITDLQGNATADPYNIMIPEDFNWSAFEDATGIWAFFYQDPAPALGLPPPAINIRSTTSSFRSVLMTYFMYGNDEDHLRIHTQDDSVGTEVKPNCTNKCDLEFVETDEIMLGKDCGEENTNCGTFHFSIALETTPGQSFVFIDKFVVYKTTLIHPTTSTKYITTPTTATTTTKSTTTTLKTTPSSSSDLTSNPTPVMSSSSEDTERPGSSPVTVNSTATPTTSMKPTTPCKENSSGCNGSNLLLLNFFTLIISVIMFLATSTAHYFL